MTRIYLETGAKKTFACSLEWPGWCRSGRTEEAAIEALMSYAPRYRVVAERAGVAFEPGDPVVVERVKGGATTDFGAPEKPAAADLEPVPAEVAARDVALMRAAWELFDETVAHSPEELRKGPRGGGRDRDKMAGHVIDAERNYARQVGVRFKPYTSAAERDALREELAALLARPSSPPWPFKWAPRYAARRVTWHVLDHVWEMEDRRQ
ncbi:hypothetical protein OIE66_23185 [Nonomuraea sp. NBC_01738]|uniref:hypothetical protein n=1 Tax=Nonomuraea sp. NBC_01738 TaxID=2976003 RepID=UPI002E124547|nr:hypothetical protein OIE66_23185 [Nonomuraea sp. NBC_01738]